MSSPIETLILNLLEAELAKHDSNPKLDAILTAIGSMEAGISAISIAVEAQASDIAAIKAQVQFIAGQFPGGPIPITDQDQAILDAEAKREANEAKQLSDLVTEVGNISTQPPQ